MTPVEDMAMLFAGREAAYAAMFRFMRVALREAVTAAQLPQTTRPANGHVPFGRVLQDQYQIFRSEHLTPPPGIPMPAGPATAEALRQAYARAYRAQLEKLHTELIAAPPWGALDEGSGPHS